MVECYREGHILKGRVAAYAPLDKSLSLSYYARELNLSGEYGQVIVTNTKDPFEGRSLFYEIHCVLMLILTSYVMKQLKCMLEMPRMGSG